MNSNKHIIEKIKEASGLVEKEDKERLVELIDIDKIDFNINERLEFQDGVDVSDLDELVASIKKVGLIHPIVVVKKGDRYEKVAGRRRIEAYKLLKKEKIPAIVLEEQEINVIEKLKMNFDENKVRKKVNIIEQTNFLLLALYEFFDNSLDKNIMDYYRNLVIKKLTENGIDIMQIPQDELKLLIAKRLFFAVRNIENEIKDNRIETESTDAKILLKIKMFEIWKIFKEKFDLNTETFKLDVMITTFDDFILALIRKNLISKKNAMKMSTIKKYPQAYRFLREKAVEIYNSYIDEKISEEEAKNEIKKLLEFILKNKQFFKDNTDIEQIQKAEKIKSLKDGAIKKLNYVLSKFSNKLDDNDMKRIENKINELYVELDQILEKVKGGESEDDR